MAALNKDLCVPLEIKYNDWIFIYSHMLLEDLFSSAASFKSLLTLCYHFAAH